MRVLRGVVKRTSYANVAATLALFIALGGASYAAFEVPPNSVGQRQLEFPLGEATATGPRASLRVWYCPPGAPCAPPRTKSLVTTHVTLKANAKLLVYGSAYFAEPGTSSRTKPDYVEIGTAVRGVGTLDQYKLPALSSPLRTWQIVSVPAGRQTIRLEAVVTGGPGSRSVRVGNPQITVIALPRLH